MGRRCRQLGLSPVVLTDHDTIEGGQRLREMNTGLQVIVGEEITTADGEVVGLSLDAPCVMRLRRRTPDGFERRKIALPPRSLYRLSGEVRWEWEHSIAPMETTANAASIALFMWVSILT